MSLSMKRFGWFEIFLVFAILVSHAWVAVGSHNSLMNWYRVDDAFYYFQTARNISNGMGVTFDGINPTNGFHPLWMLVCIPIFFFSRFNIFLPFRLLTILLGVLNAATSLLLYRWVANNLTKSAGVLAALIWAFSPVIQPLTSQSGLETGLSVFLLVLLIILISKTLTKSSKTPTLDLLFMGVIAALAFLARLDNIFIILILGIWLVFNNTTLRYFLVIDSVLIFLVAYISLLIRLTDTSLAINSFSVGIFLFIGIGLLVKIPILYLDGLYRLPGEQSLGSLIISLVKATAIGELITIGLIIILQLLKVGFSFPRSVALIDFGLSLLFIGGYRVLAFIVFGKRHEVSQDPLQFLKENWRGWLRSSSCYFGILFFVMAGYLSYNWIFFQTLLPVSSSIKQWWGTLNTVYGSPADTFFGSLGFASTQWRIFSSLLLLPEKVLSSKIYIFIYILLIFLVVLILMKNFGVFRRSFDRLLLLPILGACFWQIWTYNLRSYVGFRNWYWMTQHLFSVLVIVILFHLFFLAIKEQRIRSIVTNLVLIGLGLAIFIDYSTSVIHLITFNNSESTEGEYLFGVSFLEDNTESGAIIGFTGGGTTAYFIHDRTIVNLDGLINSSEYFSALKDRKAADFLENIGLKYVFANPMMIMEFDPYSFEFSNRLEGIKYFGDYGFYVLLQDH
jgi:hypothetical protein